MKGYLPEILISSFDTTNPPFNFIHPPDIISYEDPGCKNSSCEILVRVQLRGEGLLRFHRMSDTSFDSQVLNQP